MTQTHQYQLTGYSATPATATVTTQSFDKKERVRRALPHIEAERIVLAPDCGMKYLPRETAMGKLRAMSQAAAELRKEM